MRSSNNPEPDQITVCSNPANPNATIFPVSICCGSTEVINTSITRFCFSFEMLLSRSDAEVMITI